MKRSEVINKITSISIILLFSMITCCAQKKNYMVTIKTDMGEMVAILYDETPKHKENFIKLAKEHYYDSMIFHRIIKNFMIQGGDPDSKHAKPNQQLGTGGPGYTVEAEIHPSFFHEKGALSAARLGDAQNPKKASSGSQFYIVQGSVLSSNSIAQLKINHATFQNGLHQFFKNEKNKPLLVSLDSLRSAGNFEAYTTMVLKWASKIEEETGIKINQHVSEEKVKAYTSIGGTPHLDNEYTVFGKVIHGLDVLDKIAQVKTDPTDRPLKNIRFSISVEEMSRKKISKLYGYQFPKKNGK